MQPFDTVRFDEWQLLKEQAHEFSKLLRKQHRLGDVRKVSVWTVGNPRNCNVVIQGQANGWVWQKIIKIDIRDGSSNFWIEKFLAAEWIQCAKL